MVMRKIKREEIVWQGEYLYERKLFGDEIEKWKLFRMKRFEIIC